MSKIKGTNIAAPIVPYATNDSYPTHYAKYGKGGYMSVGNIQERDNIPEERLEEGMLVFVLEDESGVQSYQYLNNEWVPARIGQESSLNFEGPFYNARVEEGRVVVFNERPSKRLPEPTELREYSNIKLNSIYLGKASGNSKHNFLPCSHKFIELANIGDTEMSLNGLFIKYYSDTYGWRTIELFGVIYPQSTYLIRGEQVSVIDSDSTKIKVTQYNQIWENSDLNLNPTEGITFYLCWGNEDGQVLDSLDNFVDNPRTMNDIYESRSYVDCVSTSITSMSNTSINIPSDIYTTSISDMIFMRKCPLEPTYIDTNLNEVDWRFHYIRDNKYRPGASYEGKTLRWYSEDLINKEMPITTTCTIGKQVNINHDIPASRCFTWTTEYTGDSYLFIRRVGESDWDIYGSIQENTVEVVRRFNNSIEVNNIADPRILNYYEKVITEVYGGKVITTNRLLLYFKEPGIYEYRCGKIDRSNSEYVNIIWENTTNTKYVLITSTEYTSNTYLQIGNFNIDTEESSDLLKLISRSCSDLFYDTTSAIPTTIPTDFLVNTGNLVRHGSRPEEWIRYINGNEFLKYYAEFITPGPNDLGETMLYELGKEKINYRMMDLFYTFEYNTDNIPITSFLGQDLLMPGLYATEFLGNVLVSVNSSITTNPDNILPDTKTTVSDVMLLDDITVELPGGPKYIGTPSIYYRKVVEWLYKELVYYFSGKNTVMLEMIEDINDDELLYPPFIETGSSLEELTRYFPNFVTIITNKPPVEPYSDQLDNHRKDSILDRETLLRTEEDDTVDNLNNHLSFLLSRILKLWNIKTVIGNNNSGITGVTKKIHDANFYYAPFKFNTDSRQLLIDPLECYDTFQPVIIVDNKTEAIKLIKEGLPRYIWNGTNSNLVVDNNGYITIPANDYLENGYMENGDYSIFLVDPIDGGWENAYSPRYIYLGGTQDINRIDASLFSKVLRTWFDTMVLTDSFIPSFGIHNVTNRDTSETIKNNSYIAQGIDGIPGLIGKNSTNEWNTEICLEMIPDKRTTDDYINDNLSTLINLTPKLNF